MPISEGEEERFIDEEQLRAAVGAMKEELSPFLPLREAEEPAAIIIVVPAALSDEQTRKSERLSLSLLQRSHNIARCHESTRVVGVRACGGRPRTVRHYNANVSVFTAKLAQWRSSIIEEGRGRGRQRQSDNKARLLQQKKGGLKAKGRKGEAAAALPTS